MCKNIEAVFVTKDNIELASNLHYFFNYNEYEVIYFNNICQIINQAVNANMGLYLVDKCFKEYLPIIHGALKNSYLQNFVVVFVDDDISSYTKYIMPNKLFVISEKQLNFYNVRELIDLYKNNLIKNYYSKFKSKMNEELTRILTSLGIQYNKIGFTYIKDIINMIFSNNCIKFSLLKDIYPIIAMKHLTNKDNVEKDLRKSIKVARNNNPQEFTNIFLQNKVSNKEFINYLVDRLKNYHIKINEKVLSI